MLQWENTDQFGNLKVAASSASSLDDVDEDLRDLVKTVFDQHGENVTFSVDVAYGEISAPRADQVSHVLNMPFLSSLNQDRQGVQTILIDKLVGIAGNVATVQGPWD